MNTGRWRNRREEEDRKLRFHHSAIIVSSEAGIDFYKDLGFEEVERQQRETDQIVWLKGNCCMLELFLNPTHLQRVTDPEANGLRHLAFETEHLEEMRERLAKYNPEEIKEKYRIFFVKDPDGQSIEIKEYIPQPPIGEYRIED